MGSDAGLLKQTRYPSRMDRVRVLHSSVLSPFAVLSKFRLQHRLHLRCAPRVCQAKQAFLVPPNSWPRQAKLQCLFWLPLNGWTNDTTDQPLPHPSILRVCFPRRPVGFAATEIVEEGGHRRRYGGAPRGGHARGGASRSPSPCLRGQVGIWRSSGSVRIGSGVTSPGQG